MTIGPHYIPRGRKLSDDTLREYAQQVLGVLKMWGLSRADAYRLIVICKGIMADPKTKDNWGDPLMGTGMRADHIIEGGLELVKEAGKVQEFNFKKSENDS